MLLSFFKSQACTCISRNCFPLKVRHAYIFTFEMTLIVHSIYLVKIVMLLYLLDSKLIF